MTIARIVRTRRATADSPGNPFFFDDFGYTVGRSDSHSSKTTAFQAAGWSAIKDNSQSAGARGYLFTVDAITGYEGTLPGSSGRVLCIESASDSQQGDLYLQVGDNSIGSIQAPIWIQWWQYVNRSGAEMSSFNGGGKFIYPLASGSQEFFPAPTSDTGFLGGYTTSFFDANKQPVSAPSTGAITWVAEAFPISGSTLAEAPTQDRRADVTALRNDLYNRMGPHSVSGNDCWLFANTWYLHKMRIDTTGAQGIHKVWRREKGSQSWLLTHDWDGASTSGFDWNTFSPDELGWRVIRIPVTLRGDFWMYMADFALAASESDLPTYGSY